MTLRRALMWGALSGTAPVALFVVVTFTYGAAKDVLRSIGNRREGW